MGNKSSTPAPRQNLRTNVWMEQKNVLLSRLGSMESRLKKLQNEKESLQKENDTLKDPNRGTKLEELEKVVVDTKFTQDEQMKWIASQEEILNEKTKIVQENQLKLESLQKKIYTKTRVSKYIMDDEEQFLWYIQLLKYLLVILFIVAILVWIRKRNSATQSI